MRQRFGAARPHAGCQWAGRRSNSSSSATHALTLSTQFRNGVFWPAVYHTSDGMSAPMLAHAQQVNGCPRNKGMCRLLMGRSPHEVLHVQAVPGRRCHVTGLWRHHGHWGGTNIPGLHADVAGVVVANLLGRLALGRVEEQAEELLQVVVAVVLADEAAHTGAGGPAVRSAERLQ